MKRVEFFGGPLDGKKQQMLELPEGTWWVPVDLPPDGWKRRRFWCYEYLIEGAEAHFTGETCAPPTPAKGGQP